MKAYIISEDPHSGVHLANFLNTNGNKAIISEENGSDYRMQLQDLTLHKEDSDLNIIITSKPAVLTIESNKLDGIRAMLCKTADDLDSIDEAGVNTVLLDSSFSDEEICGLFKKYGSASVTERGFRQQKSAFQLTKQIDDSAQRHQKPQKKFAKPVNDDDEQKEPFWNPKKGVKKNLKDIFGLE